MSSALGTGHAEVALRPSAGTPIESLHELRTECLPACARGGAEVILSAPLHRNIQIATEEIISALESGKKVLILAATDELRDGVAAALKSRGLSDTALEIHSGVVPRDFCRELRRTIFLGPPVEPRIGGAQNTLQAMEGRLRMVPDALKQSVRGTGVSLYDAVVYLASHSPRPDYEARFDDTLLDGWSREKFEQAMTIARKLDQNIEIQGSPQHSPWRGTCPSATESLDTAELRRRVTAAHQDLVHYRTEAAKLFADLKLPLPASQAQADRAIEALAVINNLESSGGERLKNINFRSSVWTEEVDRLRDGLETQLTSTEDVSKLAGRVNFQKLRSLDLKGIGAAVMAHASKGSMKRMFDSQYDRAVESLSTVISVPKRVEDVVKVVAILNNVKELQTQAGELQPLWNDLFRGVEAELEFGNVNFWRAQAQVSWAVQRVLSTIQDNPSATALLEHLKDPATVYENSVAIQQVHSLAAGYKQSREQLLTFLGMSAETAQDQFDGVSLAEQEKRLLSMRGGLDGIDGWRAFGVLTAEASAAGFEWLAQEADRTGEVRPGLADGLQRAWMSSLAREAVVSKPALEHFDAATYLETVNRYLTSLSALDEQKAFRILKRHWDELPRFAAGGRCGELHSILDAPGDATTGQIVQTFGDLIQAAKPVMIMAPDQFESAFGADPLRFDLVIKEGTVAKQNEHTGRRVSAELSEDPFTRYLGEVLERECGFEVRNSFAPAVDLFITDPANPRSPGVAIKIDGRSYQELSDTFAREGGYETASSKNTPLKHREWIMSWYHDPAGRKEQFKEEVRTLLDSGRSKSAERPEPKLFRQSLQDFHRNPIKLTEPVVRFEAIPPDNVESAVRFIVEKSHGIERRDLPVETLKALGYRTVPASASSAITAAVTELLRAGVIEEVKGTLRKRSN